MRRWTPSFDQARCDRLRRLTETHGIVAAAEIAGTSPNAIRKVRARGWRAGRRGRSIRPMPTDFRLQCHDMTLVELAAHYRTSRTIVMRWAAEAGRKPMTGHRWGASS